MRFVKTEDLKRGMRIGRPIYNKKGVLLYDRDSKLTDQSIGSIKNFGLIGIFVLEPAEPLPPLTEEDREFERFQTVNVYALEDEIREIVSTRRTHKLESISNNIVATYGHLHHKINFIQNIRSKEDFVYKHSLNVAILCAMMCNQMNVAVNDKSDCMIAALIHDLGKTTVPDTLLKGEEDEEIERIYENSQETGFELIDTVFSSNANIRRICAQSFQMLQSIKTGNQPDKMKVFVGTRVLNVAETFDSFTAMSTTGEGEPKSFVEALKYMMKYPDVYNKKAVEALVNSINILGPGTSVELSNGDKALVISANAGNILQPMVLVFSTNQIIDLSDRVMYGDLEIVDVVKSMDQRYAMDTSELQKRGINPQ